MVTIKVDPRLLVEADPDFEVSKQGPLLAIHVPAGKSVHEYLQSCQIQLNQPAVAVVNGKTADMTRVLLPGDTVQLIPQIAGGCCS